MSREYMPFTLANCSPCFVVLLRTHEVSEGDFSFRFLVESCPLETLRLQYPTSHFTRISRVLSARGDTVVKTIGVDFGVLV